MQATQQMTIRIDAALVDERIYQAIKAHGPGKINYNALAREIGCSKVTVYRSLNRLPNSARIQRSGGNGAPVVVEAVYA